MPLSDSITLCNCAEYSLKLNKLGGSHLYFLPQIGHSIPFH